MARHRALTICTVAGCPELTTGGRCPTHQAAAEQARGTRTQRGYGTGHQRRFRPGVLARDPVCVLCHQQPSQHADHWPLSRRELVAAGHDPDDPQHGRGLCHSCHSRETARHQPGGWNAQ
ncbi:5-methylcytosine-specific restriction protein A [Kitasatospora sp. MAA19]|uniref:holin n=1 Tax=Kitasatospora sp. MAA19 TaxID=3035090 RepID=UPI00247513CF|nr:holin [Kitasatospora sp. MAA19]MDH6709759.1 5-methylcytosine-specific restriction protein A [Kitasatospora sp. MAA19]